MKLQLKNTKESYNREEKQEEDNLLQLIKFSQINNINFYIGLEIEILTI